MSTKSASKDSALEAAKGVMKRMLETPPMPHEGKGNDRRKRKTRKRTK